MLLYIEIQQFWRLRQIL